MFVLKEKLINSILIKSKVECVFCRVSDFSPPHKQPVLGSFSPVRKQKEETSVV